MENIMKRLILSLLLSSSYAHSKPLKIYYFIPWKYHTYMDATYKGNFDKNLNFPRIKAIRVMYLSSFMTDNKVDLVKMAKITESTNYDKTPISFDIEVSNSSSKQELSIILDVLKTYKKLNGKAPIGIYSFIPQNTYGTKFLSSQKKIMVENLNKEHSKVIALIDFISPSLYNYDGNNLNDWKKATLFNINEAKKYANGKPIFPYITGTYHVKGSSNALIYKDLSEIEMQQRLLYLEFLGANGVIVWQSSRELNFLGKAPIFNADKGWGKALIEYVKQEQN